MFDCLKISFIPSVFTQTQSSDYYPFGMAHTVEISSVKNGKAMEAVRAEPRETDESKTFTRSNAYLYNGKEEQPMPGKWLDYGARFYDPQLGRTSSIDPNAETYLSLSPYSMFANNPLLFVDPDGRDIRFYTWEEDKNGDWKRKAVKFNQLDPKLQKALEAFAKTKTGNAFLKDFAQKGDKIGSVEFSSNGKFAIHDLEIAQSNSDKVNNGGSTFREGEDNIIFDLKVNVKRETAADNPESMAITVGHEAFIHIAQYRDNIINAYDKNDRTSLAALEKQNKIEEAKGGYKDHKGYIKGDHKYTLMRTYVSQLRTVLNPAQVDKQIKAHDAKYKSK